VLNLSKTFLGKYGESRKEAHNCLLEEMFQYFLFCWNNKFLLVTNWIMTKQSTLYLCA